MGAIEIGIFLWLMFFLGVIAGCHLKKPDSTPKEDDPYSYKSWDDFYNDHYFYDSVKGWVTKEEYRSIK